MPQRARLLLSVVLTLLYLSPISYGQPQIYKKRALSHGQPGLKFKKRPIRLGPNAKLAKNFPKKFSFKRPGQLSLSNRPAGGKISTQHKRMILKRPMTKLPNFTGAKMGLPKFPIQYKRKIPSHTTTTSTEAPKITIQSMIQDRITDNFDYPDNFDDLDEPLQPVILKSAMNFFGKRVMTTPTTEMPPTTTTTTTTTQTPTTEQPHTGFESKLNKGHRFLTLDMIDKTVITSPPPRERVIDENLILNEMIEIIISTPDKNQMRYMLRSFLKDSYGQTNAAVFVDLVSMNLKRMECEDIMF